MACSGAARWSTAVRISFETWAHHRPVSRGATDQGCVKEDESVRMERRQGNKGRIKCLINIVLDCFFYPGCLSISIARLAPSTGSYE